MKRLTTNKTKPLWQYTLIKASECGLSQHLIVLHSPFLRWCEMIKRLVTLRTCPFLFQEALYGSLLAFLNCQLPFSGAEGPWWSEMKVTWTQALRSGDSGSDTREQTAREWGQGRGRGGGGGGVYREGRLDKRSHSRQERVRQGGISSPYSIRHET